MGCLQFLADFANFDIISHVILKKTFYFGSNCRENADRRGVNRWRKDIKVTFVSLGLHAWRFTVECAEYGNTISSYFVIFIYVSSNFALDSSIAIAEYLQCHIGLQLHTCFVNFDLVKFGENTEKEL